MKSHSITSAAVSAVSAVVLAAAVFATVSAPASAAPAKPHESAKVCGVDGHPLGVWGGYPFGCEAR